MSKRVLDGILLLDKPVGMSSNFALQKAKRLFNAQKAGHTGTLDPEASGVLPLCFGEATKFSQFLLAANKTYDVEATLGVVTTTGDKEGEILEENPVPSFSVADIERVCENFVGEISQIPPMHSAIKVNGKPLYAYAKRNKVVERKAREVTIHSIRLKSLDLPRVTFTVHCSKGTYIRTLVEDIGKALGCGAYVTELRRTGVEGFEDLPVVTFEEIGQENRDQRLLAMDYPLRHWPRVILGDENVYRLCTGQSIMLSPSHCGWVRLSDKKDQFLGVGEVDSLGFVVKRRLLSRKDD